MYCFSNEGWTSNSKEVSFNVHGILYVPESELSQDPLEVEGMKAYDSRLAIGLPASANRIMTTSPSTFRGLGSG